ncbi:hypothetical protein HDU91_007141 [Kappamyces sp. JEL0680]|nr:hypothetical protein HDU91_007141 [Kappamyces sp. JEL0680]
METISYSVETLPSSEFDTLLVASSPAAPRTQFLFGYGSLINPQSRERTLNRPLGKDDVIPVSVAGLQRSWSYRCSRRDYTAVSVSRTTEHTATNGVLIPLLDPKQDLALLDEREIHYARGLVPLSAIRFLGSETIQIPADALVWVYENHDSAFPNFNASSQHVQQNARIPDLKHSPCPNYPIPQSYLDVILGGCLLYSTDFARDFIQSTWGWRQDAYLDDRDLACSFRKYAARNEIGENICKETVDALLSTVLACKRRLSRV